MKSFILLYHYSSDRALVSVDPAYYGTGVTRGSECKRGKNGLNKSYFYTEDRPEVVVQSGSTRYVIYMPYEWKDLIYDRYEDPRDLYGQVAAEIQQSCHRSPYPYELQDGVEEKIQELGYKGWRVSNSVLPHVLVLFDALPTAKPLCDHDVYDWNGTLMQSVRYAKGARIFDAGQTASPLSDPVPPRFKY